MAGGDFEAGYATAGRGGEDRRAFRRCRSRLAGQGRAGPRPGQAGPGRRRACGWSTKSLVAATGRASCRRSSTGIVYCNTIAFCRDVYELRHARDWTEALTRLVREPARDGRAQRPVPGPSRRDACSCRAPGTTLSDEARRASERLHRRRPQRACAAGMALYRAGEIHRLRGEFAAAEERFSGGEPSPGYEPQPGLALLRLAEGKAEDAAAYDPPRRWARRRSRSRARGCCPPTWRSCSPSATLEQARVAPRRAGGGRRAPGQRRAGTATGRPGPARAVALAEGDPHARRWPRCVRALGVWQELGAPYEAARTRVAVGLACRALRGRGDGDSGAGGCPRDLRRGCGARPDHGSRSTHLLRKASSAGPVRAQRAGARKCLRLVAAGKSNREIAADLVISEHTVARHRAEHLRQARRLLPHRGRRVRVLTRARREPHAWSEMTIRGPAGSEVG